MGYRQSLSSSFNDRIGWYFVQISGDINTLIHNRSAARLANTLNGLRKFTTESHPGKLPEVEELITSIGAMITKLEAALDA